TAGSHESRRRGRRRTVARWARNACTPVERQVGGRARAAKLDGPAGPPPRTGRASKEAVAVRPDARRPTRDSETGFHDGLGVSAPASILRVTRAPRLRAPAARPPGSRTAREGAPRQRAA